MDYAQLLQAAKRSSNPRVEMRKIEEGIEVELNKVLGYMSKRDATLIYKACDSMVSRDDDLLISIICHRTKNQLNRIDMAYRDIPENKKRRTLAEKVGREVGGNYGNFMEYLCQTRATFNAGQLRKAMDGLGCNSDLVSEIFCTISNREIQEMQQSFESSSDSRLGDRLRSELSGEHKRLILKLLLAGRDENPTPDPTKARAQADELYNAIKMGKTMLGGLSSECESKITDMLTDSSPAQCRAIKVGICQIFESGCG